MLSQDGTGGAEQLTFLNPIKFIVVICFSTLFHCPFAPRPCQDFIDVDIRFQVRACQVFGGFGVLLFVSVVSEVSIVRSIIVPG